VLAGVQAAAGFAGAREDAGSLDPGCARQSWELVEACIGAGREGAPVMALIVADLSIELIETLRPLMPRIKARDKSLEDQIRRAASSIALNIGEGEYSDPGNRRARYFTAAGSAGETMAALRVAIGWGVVSRSEGERAVALLKRIIPMLWKLTRG
jgi:four helix bundle protein